MPGGDRFDNAYGAADATDEKGERQRRTHIAYSQSVSARMEDTFIQGTCRRMVQEKHASVVK